jgi:hypothetical protein
LHRAYFNGEALWTYLATPFAFAMDGFRVEDDRRSFGTARLHGCIPLSTGCGAVNSLTGRWPCGVSETLTRRF